MKHYAIPLLVAFLLLPAAIVSANRLSTIGFELNTLANGIEVTDHGTSCDSGGINSSLVSSPVHSGNFADDYNITSANFGCDEYIFANNNAGSTTVRAYIYVSSLPTVRGDILDVTGNGAMYGGLSIDTDGSLGIMDCDNNGCQYVADSATKITTNTWHYLEIRLESTTTTELITGRLDGTTFQTDSHSTGTNCTNCLSEAVWGFNIFEPVAGDGTVHLTYDDIAINDTNGNNSENGYPGASNDILLVPEAAGDANLWHKSNFNVGDSNNWNQVFAVPPPATTGGTYLVASTTAANDFYSMIASTTIPCGSTINMVSTFSRFARGATTPGAFKTQIKKTTGGTVSQGTAVTPVAATSTNAAANPRTPQLTLYSDPDGSAWTVNEINSTIQVGAADTTAGAGAIHLSAIDAYVDYVPGSCGGGSSGWGYEILI